MSDTQETLVYKRLIAQFKRAAIVTHFGYEDEDDVMQGAGISSAKRAVKALDALEPDGRKALSPLLNDSDPGVRVFAAGYLLRIMPERALSVLKEVYERGPIKVRLTAGRILNKYEDGELNMELKYIRYVKNSGASVYRSLLQ